MSNNRALEVNIPNFSAVHRVRYALASGETIGLGQWFSLNAAGEAIIAPASPNALTFLNFQDSGDPSVFDIQTDNFVSGATPANNQTRGVDAFVGQFPATVDNNEHEDRQIFNQFDKLTVKSGKLTPQAGGEPIFAYVEKAIGADARLNFILTTTSFD